MDPLISTVLFGFGFLICGFLLGKGPWMKLGEKSALTVLYDEKLLVPEDVIKHFLEKESKNKGA